MENIIEAEHKFNDYYECPHFCGAVYHTYSLTSRNYECKDCKKLFRVPSNVIIKKPAFSQPKKKVQNG